LITRILAVKWQGRRLFEKEGLKAVLPLPRIKQKR
jgi:hypothetical protein